MARERLKTPRTRMFVALELPDPLQEALVEWRDRTCTDPALRPAAHPIHVTLAFLGWQRQRDADAIAEAALSIDSVAPHLALAPDPLPVPPRGRPRLFAVGFAPGGQVVEALQGEVSDRLEAAHFYRPEKRPFWPHATVARVRSERGPGKKPRLVHSAPGPLPEGLLFPFDAVRVTLYRSDLRPQGAEYTPMAGTELPLAAADS